MKKILVSLLAAGATVMALTTPSNAAPPDPQGLKCRFNSATDVTAEAQTQAGYAEIGPLIITSSSGTVAAWCQIYVNGIPAPGGRVDAIVTHLMAEEYLAVGAGPITYHANVGDVVSMCTFATYDGDEHYWSPGAPPPAVPTLGEWPLTSSGGVPTNCAQSTTIDPNPEACPPLLTIDQATGNVGHLAETWQDCEPYSPIPLPPH